MVFVNFKNITKLNTKDVFQPKNIGKSLIKHYAIFAGLCSR